MRDEGKKLPFLDGIRGVAILFVFLFHLIWPAVGYNRLPWDGWIKDFDAASLTFVILYPFAYGGAGVALFFVVSGFCIHLSFMRGGGQGWRKFFNRRFFRIYPPYLLALLVFFFVWPWGSLSLNSSERWIQLLTHLAATHNIDHRTFHGINPSFWSIALEVQLYLLYPLLIFIVGRVGMTRAMLAIGVLEVGIRSIVAFCDLGSGAQPPHFVTYSPFTYWFSWSMGAYLAQCYLDGKVSLFSKLRIDIAILFAILCPLFRPIFPFRFLSFALIAAVVIDRLMSGAWVLPKGRWFAIPWRHLGFLGLVSYSFYLIHQPLISVADHAIGFLSGYVPIPPMLEFVLLAGSYPVILAIAYAMYRFVELPSSQLGRRLGGTHAGSGGQRPRRQRGQPRGGEIRLTPRDHGVAHTEH